MNAASSGMIAMKIMVVACMVNRALKVWALTMFRPGRISWRRIMNASKPPTRKKINAVIKYRMPIRLWSTVVTHDQNPVWAVGRGRMPSVFGCAAAVAISHYPRVKN